MTHPRNRKKGEKVERGIWKALVLRDGLWTWEKGDGYIAEVHYQDAHTRQRKREWKSFNRLDVAREWRSAQKTDADRGQIRGKEKKAKPILFKKFADEYLKAWKQERKASTADREERRVDGVLVEHFGNMSLHTITRKHVEDFITRRREGGNKKKKDKGICTATANRDLVRLSSMFKRAVAWGYLEVNPLAGLSQAKEQNEEASYLSREEVARLLASCPDKIRPLITAAVNTGMRWGELMALEWKDVNFERGLLTVRDPKNRETRHVPMNVTVRETLEAHRRRQAQEVEGIISHVFARPETGKPWVDVRKTYYEALKDAKITRRVTFHGLRHTAASHMVMNGVDLRTVGKILGHKTAQITLRYAHLAPDHLKGAVDRLDFTVKAEEERAGGEAQQ
jgi:integrase